MATPPVVHPIAREAARATFSYLFFECKPFALLAAAPGCDGRTDQGPSPTGT